MIFPGRFAGKAVVVTGAAQGIGRTVAGRIAGEGGKLALVDRAPLVEEVRHEAEAAGAEQSPSSPIWKLLPGPSPRSMVRKSTSTISTS